MFAELNNLLSWAPGQLPLQRMMFVKEMSQEGSLVLHHLLSHFLKGTGSVCLVGLAQSFTHYNTVANRLSINLNKLKEDNRFAFVDAIDHIGRDSLIQCGLEPSGDEKSSWPDHVPTDPHSSLKGLYVQLKNIVANLKENTLVILDDVSVFMSLGIPALDVMYLCQYLKRFLFQHQSSLAILCHCGDEDDELDVLCKQLTYQSDIIFEVSSLKTGFCIDVHGEMKITTKDSSCPGQIATKNVQFKISDKNVQFFALGLSRAVIGH
jgi:hypothetical protein